MSGRMRVGVLVVVLAAGAAVGQATAGPGGAPAGPHVLAVLDAVAVCPDVRQDADRTATVVTAGRLVAAPELAAGPLGAPPVSLPPGAVVRDLGAATAGAFVVTGTGPGAGGIVVEQATRTTGGTARGLAAVSCPAPATSGWFVGGATVVGASAELLLVNVEDVAALVDVRIWTKEGPADPRPGRGLSVPPRGRLVVPLDRLAPDRDLLALHLQTSRGRVASALRVTRSDGRTPLGTDWVPPSQPPAAEVVVTGVPAGPGPRSLVLTNPTRDDAVAQVELTGIDGQHVPRGLDAVAVPAGSSVEVDLSDSVSRTPASLRVRSDGPPLLAGALVVDAGGRGAVRDLAFAASTSALDAPALLADVPLSPGTEVTLLLSALDADAVVELRPVAAPGQLPAPRRVAVPAGTTAAVRLRDLVPEGSTGSLGVEVRPVSGRVHGARYVRQQGGRGPLTTLLPLSASRLAVERPVVAPDPGAGR